MGKKTQENRLHEDRRWRLAWHLNYWQSNVGPSIRKSNLKFLGHKNNEYSSSEHLSWIFLSISPHEERGLENFDTRKTWTLVSCWMEDGINYTKVYLASWMHIHARKIKQHHNLCISEERGLGNFDTRKTWTVRLLLNWRCRQLY